MRRDSRTSALLSAATAATFFLGACTPEGTPEPGVSTAATSQPPPTAPGSQAPAATALPSTTPTAGTSSAAGLATFTFPDGRLSFTRPADWRTEVFEASASPYVGTATVYDAAGREQITIFYGQIADSVTGPVTRTVFDSVPVPGLQGRSTPEARASFYVDWDDDDATCS